MAEVDFSQEVMNAGRRAIDIMTDYFEGALEYGHKVQMAMKFVPQTLKLMHMQQHRELVERSQAIRLLPYLKDAESKEKYIKITQPGMAELLEHRPKK